MKENVPVPLSSEVIAMAGIVLHRDGTSMAAQVSEYGCQKVLWRPERIFTTGKNSRGWG
jgi:hypothetical protein